jgi:hypothetical protein
MAEGIGRKGQLGRRARVAGGWGGSSRVGGVGSATPSVASITRWRTACAVTPARASQPVTKHALSHRLASANSTCSLVTSASARRAASRLARSSARWVGSAYLTLLGLVS